MSEHGFIEMSIDIAARPETVFTFFTDPARFAQWMGKSSTIEARTGGKLRVLYPNGDAAEGELVELSPFERIVFTWGYINLKQGLPPGTSTVICTLQPIATGTRLTVRHEGLPTQPLRDGHVQGWRYYFGVMAAESSRAEFSGSVDSTVDAFIAAWNEKDAKTRTDLLTSCMTDDATFRDPLCAIRDRAEMDAYMAQVHVHAPGSKLERIGPVQLVHGHFQFPTRSTFSGFPAPSDGHNVGQLSPDGRIRWIIGFWTPPK